MEKYLVMSIPKIVVEGYTFSQFVLRGYQLRFFVASISERDLNDEDKQIVESILASLGKWECLVKTGLQFFSDLGFINPDLAVLEKSEKPFGSELYSIGVSPGGTPEHLTVFVTLVPEERFRREAAGLNLLQVEEVQAQLSNVPKWKNFEKTLKILKSQWR